MALKNDNPNLNSNLFLKSFENDYVLDAHKPLSDICSDVFNNKIKITQLYSAINTFVEILFRSKPSFFFVGKIGWLKKNHLCFSFVYMFVGYYSVHNNGYKLINYNIISTKYQQIRVISKKITKPLVLVKTVRKLVRNTTATLNIILN